VFTIVVSLSAAWQDWGAALLCLTTTLEGSDNEAGPSRGDKSVVMTRGAVFFLYAGDNVAGPDSTMELIAG
jgi:hypothetical protein